MPAGVRLLDDHRIMFKTSELVPTDNGQRIHTNTTETTEDGIFTVEIRFKSGHLPVIEQTATQSPYLPILPLCLPMNGGTL
jgi:hypothetical protein